MNGVKKTIPFWICLIVSIGLFVSGFCVPPMGIIDGTVLTAVGILFGFATLAQIPVIIEVAGYVKMTKGDMTIEAKGQNQNHD